MAQQASPPVRFQVVAELGPGDSLGLGLAALLSGAQTYYAFDIVPYTRNDRNLRVLRDLVELFRRREPIPDADEFPEALPRLQDWSFPGGVLTEAHLEETLDPARVAAIERAVVDVGGTGGGPIAIRYRAPWNASESIDANSVDLIFSQAVLEHIDDLEGTYAAMHRWLRPQGLLSQQIDLRAHYLDRRWNAHWTYPDLAWRLIRGRRPYLLNRQPLSAHLAWLERTGFEVVRVLKEQQASAVRREQLARRFRYLSDEDLTTCGVYIQARRR
jgi:SAM-dependent methyltransferase